MEVCFPFPFSNFRSQLFSLPATKFKQNRAVHGCLVDDATNFRGLFTVVQLQLASVVLRGEYRPNCIKFGKVASQLSMLREFFLTFQMCCCVSKREWLDQGRLEYGNSKLISDFLTPTCPPRTVKGRSELAQCLSDWPVRPRPNLWQP